MTQRFRFAVGTLVTVVDEKRLRRRIVERKYMHQPPKNDVYWLDKPVRGFRYFNGDDLLRVKNQSGKLGGRPLGKKQKKAQK